MRPETFDLMAASMIADIFREAESAQWLKRADDFEATKPRVGEFHGDLTRTELSARWRWADETARQCRERASACRAEDWKALILADIRDLDAEIAQRRRGVA